MKELRYPESVGTFWRNEANLLPWSEFEHRVIHNGSVNVAVMRHVACVVSVHSNTASIHCSANATEVVGFAIRNAMKIKKKKFIV